MAETNFKQRLLDAQNMLKCSKSQYNSFGKYKYRSCEDILEAAKPICLKQGLLLTLSDSPKVIGERYYIEATARVDDIHSDEFKAVTASARECETKKGMDESQISGTASSYARKYALGGLFNLDDTKDADTESYAQETKRETSTPTYKCDGCGVQFKSVIDKSGRLYTAEEVYNLNKAKSPAGKCLCKYCREKLVKEE